MQIKSQEIVDRFTKWLERNDWTPMHTTAPSQECRYKPPQYLTCKRALIIHANKHGFKLELTYDWVFHKFEKEDTQNILASHRGKPTPPLDGYVCTPLVEFTFQQNQLPWINLYGK